MMPTLKRWCVQLGLWLIRVGDGGATQARALLPAVPDAVLVDARTLVQYQERWQARDGEAKRAQVYHQLGNAHPTVSKRVLALAIEEAVCSVS